MEGMFKHTAGSALDTELLRKGQRSLAEDLPMGRSGRRRRERQAERQSDSQTPGRDGTVQESALHGRVHLRRTSVAGNGERPTSVIRVLLHVGLRGGLVAAGKGSQDVAVFGGVTVMRDRVRAA